ncbi:putative Malectin domain-containing protein [Helianthus annuus]|nr:putative Malectin domain-containing protein [Helianthus annuus]
MYSFALEIFSLHINCGGAEVNINNTIIYEADTERRGASSYYNAGNWAFSSTGNFLDEDHDFDDYMLSNTSNLYNTHDSDAYTLSNTSELYNTPKCDMELYTTARKAAISLTYYGLCLLNGKYTVKLHFAEIGLTDDNLFNSIGKRVFNVYVQVVQLLNGINMQPTLIRFLFRVTMLISARKKNHQCFKKFDLR